MYDLNNPIGNGILRGFNGLVLGILVSSIAIYGFTYILAYKESTECDKNNIEECITKGIISNNKDVNNIPSYNSLMITQNSTSTLKWTVSIILCIVFLLIILVYTNAK